MFFFHTQSRGEAGRPRVEAAHSQERTRRFEKGRAATAIRAKGSLSPKHGDPSDKAPVPRAPARATTKLALYRRPSTVKGTGLPALGDTTASPESQTPPLGAFRLLPFALPLLLRQ